MDDAQIPPLQINGERLEVPDHAGIHNPLPLRGSLTRQSGKMEEISEELSWPMT